MSVAMLKPKLSAVLSLLLVFASGALVGVLGHRAYTISAANAAKEQPKRRDPRDWRKHFAGELKEKVKLNDQQLTRVNLILDEVDSEYRTMFGDWNKSMAGIQESLVAKVNSLLTPEQKQLYKQFREEREHDRQRRQGPPPPRPH
jgi:hypothetical protein